jgi:hypothetical protein
VTSRHIARLIIYILLAVAGGCGVPVQQTAPAPTSVQRAEGGQTSAPSLTPETPRRDEQKSDGLRQKAAASFQGTWSVEYENKAGGFDLLLIQEGENLHGYHSVVTQNGNKVDDSDPDEDEPTIVGRVEGNIAFVDFSTVGNKDKAGKAKITLEDGKIRWEVIPPINGWNLYPNKAVLRKMSDKTIW